LELSNIQIRSHLSPKIIVDKDKSFFITSENYPPTGINGLTIYPQLKNISQSGKLLISQFAIDHVLSISRENKEPILFSSDGRKYRDTHLSTDTFYKQYYLNDGKFYEDQLFIEEVEPIFNDAPYRELLGDWTAVYYLIVFETWYLFENNNSIQPLGKFIWKVDCKMIKSNHTWTITNNQSSLESSIKNSFDRFNSVNDIFISNHQTLQLMDTVQNFLSKNL